MLRLSESKGQVYLHYAEREQLREKLTELKGARSGYTAQQLFFMKQAGVAEKPWKPVK